MLKDFEDTKGIKRCYKMNHKLKKNHMMTNIISIWYYDIFILLYFDANTE